MTSLVERTAVAALLVAVVSGCGAPATVASAPSPGTPIPSALLNEARPIGVGPRFQPAVNGPVIGACERSLGPRRGVHVEVFADNRVLLLPAGIGTESPRTMLAGRVTSARCYGALVTTDPTGLVLVRPGAQLTLGALFRSWGQQLSPNRLVSFGAPAGKNVAVFINGRRWQGVPGAVPLTAHAEIVLEVGPYVPPHPSYTFPRGT